MVTGSSTRCCWEQIARAVATSVVECPLSSFEHHVDLVSIDCSQGSWIQQLRVLTIHRLQFHVHLKVIVLWRCRLLQTRTLSK